MVMCNYLLNTNIIVTVEKNAIVFQLFNSQMERVCC